ncbi:serine/threonine-protein kinase [Pseudarthrobacter sp. J75]|uniref:serine/threonine-protein kinase n=1 Tax=unclassified Pseudarthrobacter TaxID=2647000 RepID=UPI002E81C83A|nr:MULTISPECIES: serine/threonine-protein kinase [unclassified Pseudarthrobacter]MEE2522733.1 serine/threonine-protein kinase [Pseudarthrobacter sp. J47]MEE2529594.1 serine/threonine-protein kinase [Pseudarthrobacter sp. J75]
MNNGGSQQTTPPQVPGFSVGRELGRGGSADVWLVEAERTGGRFALKCFHTPVAEEDVRRELRILSVLDHQHLVKAHDAVRAGGEGNPRLGILLDFAAGGSLAQLIAARGRLTVGETVTVLTPLAQALSYLHAKGFTHADVSPGNVLFTAEGKPLLADVGIARMVGDPAAAERAGTPGFCDPAPVDTVRMGLQPERDLYSLAAVGWFCLTGETPPPTPDRPPLPLIFPDVPPALAAALESALHEDRRQRPTAAEFATAVYRSAAPAAVGLSTSVHPSVIPELLTRRRLPETAPDSLRGRLQAWRRRLVTLRMPGTSAKTRRAEDPADAPDGAPGPGRRSVATNTGSRRSRPRMARLLGVPAFLALLAAAALFWGQALVPHENAANLPDPVSAASPGATPAAGSGGEEQGSGIPAGVEAQLAAEDPAVAVLGLAWLRSEAFRTGNAELLGQVNVAGSAAADADARIMAGLQDSGRVLGGFAMELRAIDVQPGGTDLRSLVGVDSAATAYREVSASGEQLAERAAAPAQRLVVELHRDGGRWRISDILQG